MAESRENTTILGPDATFKGEMTFEGSAHIRGTFEGTVTSEGELHVDGGANVKATVKAQTISVDGKVEGDLKTLRKAIPVKTLQTTNTAWEVALRTSVEMYTIWEETGVLKQLETMDENLFDVIQDFIDDKRESYEEWLEEQEDKDDE